MNHYTITTAAQSIREALENKYCDRLRGETLRNKISVRSGDYSVLVHVKDSRIRDSVREYIGSLAPFIDCDGFTIKVYVS